MEVICNNYMPGDTRLVAQLVSELKSQGIFDQFRKECISDVDTKPAYQNLRQRVEGTVTTFLNQQAWSIDLNKNQLREQLRKNLQESGFLETGVERIVDQVVNPKISTVFLPKVEDVVYSYLGVERPAGRNVIKKVEETKVCITDLLPTDLEAISPESVDSFKTGKKNDSLQDSLPSSGKMDEDESPPFEPLGIQNSNSYDNSDTKMEIDENENSRDSHLSGFSGLQSHESHQGSDMKTYQMDLSNPDSLNSIDTRLSIITSEETTKMETFDDSMITEIKNDKIEVKSDEVDNVIEAEVPVEEILDVKKEEPINDVIVEDIHVMKDDRIEEIEKKDRKEDKKSRSSEKSKDRERKDDKHKKSSSSKDKDKERSSSSKYSSHRDSKDSKDVKKDSKSSSASGSHSHKDKDKSKERSGDRKDKYKEKSRNADKSKSDKDKEKEKEIVDKSKTDKNKYEKDKDKSSTSTSRDKDKSSTSTSRDKDKDKYKSDKDKHSKDKDKEKSKHKDKNDKDRSSRSKEKYDKNSNSKDKEKSSNASKEIKERVKDNDKDSSKDKDKSKSSNNSNSNDSSKHSSSKDASRKKDKYKDDSKSKSSKKDSNSNSGSQKAKDPRDRDSSSSSSKKKSKDDHYSSKIKKTDRRSTDRDSNDGTSSKNNCLNSYTESVSSKSQDQSSSSFSGGSGDSGNSEPVETVTAVEVGGGAANEGVREAVSVVPMQIQPVKYMKPKFASNFEEARKIMKIRKQLARMERQNQLSLTRIDIPHIENGVVAKERENVIVNVNSRLPNDIQVDDDKIQIETVDLLEKERESVVEKAANTIKEDIVPISEDSISSTSSNEDKKNVERDVLEEVVIEGTHLSMENFEALEAKLAQVMSKINYNSYESDEDYEFHGYSSTDLLEAVPEHAINLCFDETEMQLMNHRLDKEIVPVKNETIENVSPKNTVNNVTVLDRISMAEKMEIPQPNNHRVNNVRELSVIIDKSLADVIKNDDCYYLDNPSAHEENNLKFLRRYVANLQIEINDCEETSRNNFWPSNRGKKRKLEECVDFRNNNDIGYVETEIIPDEHFSLPLSPAESDKSNDRKEEDLLIPMKQKRIIRGYSQRYSSEDLYKPRPIIGRRNKFSKNTN